MECGQAGDASGGNCLCALACGRVGWVMKMTTPDSSLKLESAISLRNVTISYDRHPAVHHLSGQFAVGSLTAIAGANGSGKSSLLKAIAGVIDNFEGSIEFAASTPADLAYLPQTADLQRDFPLSVLQMVTSGFWQKCGAFAAISSQQRQKAMLAIEQVGLRDLATRTLDSLSVGQFQRALFARLIVQDAKVILLDEPFAAVDENTTKKLLDVIKGWHNQGKTVICVLHDFEQIKTHFPECLLMARKVVAWGKSSEVLKPENLFSARLFRESASGGHEVCAL